MVVSLGTGKRDIKWSHLVKKIHSDTLNFSDCYGNMTQKIHTQTRTFFDCYGNMTKRRCQWAISRSQLSSVLYPSARTTQMMSRPQALHQPSHTRHSLYAGSGTGYVMYTLEGTKRFSSKPWTSVTNSQRTSLTPITDFVHMLCLWILFVIYSMLHIHPYRFVSFVNNKYIVTNHYLSTEPVTGISGIHMLKCENDQWNYCWEHHESFLGQREHLNNRWHMWLQGYNCFP